MDEGYYHLKGDTGFQILKLPKIVHTEVKGEIDKIQNNFNTTSPANSTLVGQIDQEYFISLKKNTHNFIKEATNEFLTSNDYPLHDINSKTTNPPLKLTFKDSWVNFQKKHEYNPIHNHAGILSWVIWYQIPFKYEEEKIKGPGSLRRGANENGQFEFIFHDGDKINSYPLNIDKTREGYMAIFPSYLNHIVYPFYTSDDYRITLSGNIYFSS